MPRDQYKNVLIEMVSSILRTTPNGYSLAAIKDIIQERGGLPIEGKPLYHRILRACHEMESEKIVQKVGSRYKFNIEHSTERMHEVVNDYVDQIIDEIPFVLSDLPALHAAFEETVRRKVTNQKEAQQHEAGKV